MSASSVLKDCTGTTSQETQRGFGWVKRLDFDAIASQCKTRLRFFEMAAMERLGGRALGRRAKPRGRQAVEAAIEVGWRNSVLDLLSRSIESNLMSFEVGSCRSTKRCRF